MTGSTIPSILRPLRLLPLLLSGLLLLYATGCEDAASPATEISVRITQPQDSQTVQDTVLRIIAEASSSCGCQAYVEFRIDGVHQYSDYLPFFSFDWDIRNVSGWHQIATRVVVPNRGDAWDSVRVLINP